MNIPIKTISRADLRAMGGGLWRGKRSKLEPKFELLWKSQQPYQLVREFRFHETRKWRFDFAHLASKTAIEIQGGGFGSMNFHGSGVGMQRDCEKSLASAVLGWLVIPITGKMITTAVIEQIASVIHRRLPHNALPP